MTEGKITKIFSDRVYYRGDFCCKTITIKDDTIIDISDDIDPEAIDYALSIIMPGIVDTHVHINEPGRTAWEGFKTATTAAAFGGITTIVDMPLNSSPVTINKENFQKKIEATKGKLNVNCGFWGGSIGQDLSDIDDLLKAGCLGIKVFISDSGLEEFPNISIDDLDTLMEHCAKKDAIVLAHCELDTLDAPKCNGNLSSYQNYLNSRPKEWENEAVKIFTNLSEKHNCKAHIVHLASDEIIPWIQQKQNQGTPITVETCAHYIYFEASKIKDGNTLLKCAPPIRDEKNRRGLVNGIKKNVIDFITTDHSPAPPNLKETISGDFSKAWGGIAGLQFLLPASWTYLKGDLTPEEFIPLLTSRPANFLHLQKRGSIEIGNKADFCIWDPEEEFIVTEDIIQHKHKASPYLNEKLFGTITATYVNGVCVYENGKLIESNKGELILRSNNEDA